MSTPRKVGKLETVSDFKNFIVYFVTREPFFGHILRIVNLDVDVDGTKLPIPTAGVYVKDDMLNMIVSKEYGETLTEAQMLGLIKHEVFHLVFNHCTSRALKPQMVGNIAADLAINSMIPAEEMPPGGIVPGTMPTGEMEGSPLGLLIESMPLNKSMEWYFLQIMQNEAAREQCEKMQQGGSPGVMDAHDGWGDMSDEAREILMGRVKNALKRGIEAADRTNSWGNISAATRKILRELSASSVDWRAVLRQFSGQSKRGDKATSWSNINIVHIDPDHGPLAPGYKYNWTSSIAVYIDQSGSVSDKEIELAFGELKHLTRRTEFTTFHFDTQVDLSSEMKWNRKMSAPPARTRSGGTDFQCVTKHANANRHRFDGYIIITDGGAPRPDPSKLKRLWLLTPGQSLYFGQPDKADRVAAMKWPKSSGM